MRFAQFNAVFAIAFCCDNCYAVPNISNICILHIYIYIASLNRLYRTRCLTDLCTVKSL